MSLFDNIFLQKDDFEDEPEFMPLFSIGEEGEEDMVNEKYPDELPILALKNTVMFPGVVIPITVGREKSINAINAAYESNRLIGVLSQIDSQVEDPQELDLFGVGTIARILKLIKMPDGSTTAILQGRKRFKVDSITAEHSYIRASFFILENIPATDAREFDAFVASIKEQAQRIIDLSPNIPSEAGIMLRNIDKGSFLLNFIGSNLNSDVSKKQQLLEIDDQLEKAQKILEHLNDELQLLELKDQIESKVRVDLDKQQRDYFLNQQLKTIQEELGGNPHEKEIESLIARAGSKQWNKEVEKAFTKEITKLRRINPAQAEYGITLTYLETLLDLPWNEFTDDNFDLRKAEKILDSDHYGLEKVKDRILEHLAVLKLKGDMKAPILCLVGPPGVGKTSLGKSIANALDRKYVRMSLGGLHDESEIRGHRKTYIGALPGRIIQSLKKAKSANPVFILDEIDKVGKDFRGDPSSALLEVLDPEQNSTFHDNYLELEYDLSKVMFIATANSLNTIQPALLDRMEIIQVAGYSLEEKVEIAKKHLIPRQRKEHGITAKQVKVGVKTLRIIVEDYTRESGVRSLDRQIAGVMRYVAKEVAMGNDYDLTIKPEQLEDILGPKLFSKGVYQEDAVPGVVVGLAWTSVGGDILFIETSISKGKGRLTLTGNLGEVMKESATTALSYLRANAEEYNIDSEDFENKNIHIHVPQGAIPKDGPSAGITMLTALTSAFTNKPVKKHLAMTGEITLRGKVLPVGGIKEKVLAAKRAGIKHIIMCHENERDIRQINEDYIKGVEFHYVKRMSEVLDIALG